MTDVVMPQMGESIVEGTLTKWLKKPGEHVERDEPLFEIWTDKVDTEIPSPAAGTLSEVLVEEGKTVGINTIVARIEQPPAPPVPAAAPVASARPAEQAKVRIEPMSPMRAKIAEHMVMSKRTSAHVTTVHKVDMTRVEKMRQKHKADFQARYGISLTYLPFITRATVEGLRAYPLLNASIEGANIVYHNEINIGIAVALENGLIVPVIRNADEKNVLGLQRAIVDLSTRARSRQLKPDEVQGGTFSITSFGGFGSVIATPVINQPQVAILGAGLVEKTPVVIDDAIAIRSICYLSLSFDHRLIDGALADQFTGKVKSVLENWSDEVL